MGKNYLKGRHLVFVSPIVPKDQIRSFYEKLQLFDQKIKSEVEKHCMIRETHLLPLLHHACLVGNDMYYDASSSKTVEMAAKIAQDQWRFAIDNGAFIDAQQGNLTGFIASNWSPEFRQFMLNLKRTIDPNNIMNPGLWNL